MTTTEQIPKTETTEPIQPPETAMPIQSPETAMQYRAIGLLLGRYVPNEGELTLGTLHTTDGTQIEAVILGKLLGLVKSRIDLEKEHL